MNNLDLTASWVQSLGWTLLNSLWQAPLLAVIMLTLLKLTPGRSANFRHGVAFVALCLVLLSSITTFFLLQANTSGYASWLASTSPAQTTLVVQTPVVVTDLSFPSTTVIGWLNTHLDWIIQLWMAGFILFISRLILGFWYIHRLRHQSVYLADHLADRLQQLARQLSIDRLIALAEAPIDAPLVIGYLRPVIVFPLGLLSGLTTEQVEAIFVHELSHIRRHDFLINLAQSVAESIFFFNPFVWMISSIINKEREHCCDDMVLANGSSPLTYAKTLAQLEEARLSPPLVFGLGGNKNQLLNRIKRIMEKTAVKDSGKARLLPLVLVVLGLVFASWLSIGNEEPGDRLTDEPDQTAAADTVKEKTTGKSSSYERRKITRWDENGEPHEEVVEVIEGDAIDEEDGDWFAMPAPLAYPSFPGFPDSPDSPSLPGFPDFTEGNNDFFVLPPGMAFTLDSIPGRHHYRLNEEEWAAFEEEFKTKFKEQFKDFYSKNEEQLEKLMDEARKGSHEWNSVYSEDLLADNLRLMEKELAMLEPRLHDFEKHIPDMERVQRDMEGSQRDMERSLLDMQRYEKDMQRWKQDMARHEKEMKVWEERSRVFEKDVKELLVQDGYLEKNETIKTLKFDDDGDITVNGKEVKEKDKAKYKELHRKHFKNGSHFHIEE